MSITGSNNPFACEPVVFANANAIVSLGTITRDGNQFTFSVGFVWKINGVTYQNTAPVVLTIAEASTGFQRIDNALLNTSNTIELQQGLESETIALRPIAPDTNIILTSWNISDSAIGTPTDPITGTQFIKKSDAQPFQFLGSGSDAIIPLSPLGSSEIRLQNPALVSIAGFDLSLIIGISTAEVPYQNKPYRIRNLTGNPVIVKNELIVSDSPFFLTGGSDLIIPNKESLYVTYDASGFLEAWRSWSVGGGKKRQYIVNCVIGGEAGNPNFRSLGRGINPNIFSTLIGVESYYNPITDTHGQSRCVKWILPFDCYLKEAYWSYSTLPNPMTINIFTGNFNPASPIDWLNGKTLASKVFPGGDALKFQAYSGSEIDTTYECLKYDAVTLAFFNNNLTTVGLRFNVFTMVFEEK